jgi:PPP family 3-phenylpropionic acid transporter
MDTGYAPRRGRRLWGASLRPGTRGALFYLAYWGIVGVYWPFINVYFIELGLSGSEIGILSALLPAMTLVAAPPLTALADRRRWRVAMLTVALAGLACSLALMTFARDFVLLLPLMALLALMRAPVAPLGDSLVARMAVRHGLSYGRLRLWGSFSFALIALGFGALWQRIGFEWMFLIGGVLFVPVCWCALLLEEDGPRQRMAEQPETPFRLEVGVVVLLAITLLVGAATGMSALFEGVAMARISGGGLMVGVLFAVMAFSQLPTMWFGDQLVRRFNGGVVLLLAYALQAGAFAGYALASQPWHMLLAASVSGLGFGLFFITTVQLLDARAPAGHSATLQGIMNAGAWGLAPLISGPAGGFLYDTFGPASVFAVSAGLTVLALLVLLVALQLRLLNSARPRIAATPN